MRFRYARHSNDLNALRKFYTQVIGLDVIGSFENHNNYDGLFLGQKAKDWHLEFTVSSDKADHHPDPDDLLVFYLSSSEEIRAVLTNAKANNYEIVRPKNPYWQEHGHQLTDPDGFGVIITLSKS